MAGQPSRAVRAGARASVQGCRPSAAHAAAAAAGAGPAACRAARPQIWAAAQRADATPATAGGFKTAVHLSAARALQPTCAPVHQPAPAPAPRPPATDDRRLPGGGGRVLGAPGVPAVARAAVGPGRRHHAALPPVAVQRAGPAGAAVPAAGRLPLPALRAPGGGAVQAVRLVERRPRDGLAARAHADALQPGAGERHGAAPLARHPERDADARAAAVQPRAARHLLAAAKHAAPAGRAAPAHGADRALASLQQARGAAPARARRPQRPAHAVAFVPHRRRLRARAALARPTQRATAADMPHRRIQRCACGSAPVAGRSRGLGRVRMPSLHACVRGCVACVAAHRLRMRSSTSRPCLRCSCPPLPPRHQACWSSRLP